jgi:hypothetical protein
VEYDDGEDLWENLTLQRHKLLAPPPGGQAAAAAAGGGRQAKRRRAVLESSDDEEEVDDDGDSDYGEAGCSMKGPRGIANLHNLLLLLAWCMACALHTPLPVG